MAQTSIAQMRRKSVDRTAAATAIIEAGGVIELEAQPGVFVIADRAGSGKGHLSTLDSCDCKDHTFRRKVCKHMRAARLGAGVVVCETCGAYTTRETNWIGGRGYCTFEVCSADKSHTARRVE